MASLSVREVWSSATTGRRHTAVEKALLIILLTAIICIVLAIVGLLLKFQGAEAAISSRMRILTPGDPYDDDSPPPFRPPQTIFTTDFPKGRPAYPEPPAGPKPDPPPEEPKNPGKGDDDPEGRSIVQMPGGFPSRPEGGYVPLEEEDSDTGGDDDGGGDSAEAKVAKSEVEEKNVSSSPKKLPGGWPSKEDDSQPLLDDTDDRDDDDGGESVTTTITTVSSSVDETEQIPPEDEEDEEEEEEGAVGGEWDDNTYVEEVGWREYQAPRRPAAPNVDDLPPEPQPPKPQPPRPRTPPVSPPSSEPIPEPPPLQNSSTARPSGETGIITEFFRQPVTRLEAIAFVGTIICAVTVALIGLLVKVACDHCATTECNLCSCCPCRGAGGCIGDNGDHGAHPQLELPPSYEDAVQIEQQQQSDANEDDGDGGEEEWDEVEEEEAVEGPEPYRDDAGGTRPSGGLPRVNTATVSRHPHIPYSFSSPYSVTSV